MVRVDGVFLADESGQLRHVSRHLVAELTEVEPSGPWRVELRSALKKPLAALADLRCAVTVPRIAGVFEVAVDDEDREFDGTFYVVRGRIVIELVGGGAARARHEA